MELFVARDKRRTTRYDIGSQLCLNVLSLLPEDAVSVREVTRSTAPTWVTGTPSLYDPTQHHMWQGYEAFNHLQAYAFQQCKENASNRRGRSSSRRGASHGPVGAGSRNSSSAAPVSSRQAACDHDPWDPPPADEHADAAFATREETGDEENDSLEQLHSRKMNGDDLARAMQARASTTVDSEQGNRGKPPAFEPEKD